MHDSFQPFYIRANRCSCFVIWQKNSWNINWKRGFAEIPCTFRYWWSPNSINNTVNTNQTLCNFQRCKASRCKASSQAWFCVGGGISESHQITCDWMNLSELLQEQDGKKRLILTCKHLKKKKKDFSFLANGDASLRLCAERQHGTFDHVNLFYMFLKVNQYINTLTDSLANLGLICLC